MTYKVYLTLILSAFIAACGGSSASNLNASNSAANPAGNSNFTAETAKPPVEVPTFDNASAALEAGRKYFDEDEDEAAVKAFEQAVNLDPTSAEAHLHLALAHDAIDNEEEGEKHYKESIKLYQKITAKNPQDAAAYYNLGRAYDKINDDQKAEKSLRQAVKLNAEDTQYRYEYGAILVKLAQYTEAIRELKKSLELDPENTRAEELLGRAEAGEIRVKDAQAKNKKAAQEQASQPRGKTEKTETVSDEEEAPKPHSSSSANKP